MCIYYICLCRFLFSNIYINVNRFESEKKSFQKQIIEFQNNFDIGEKKIGILEFENSEYKLKSNTEIGRLNVTYRLCRLCA
jgi:hypothetical protein